RCNVSSYQLSFPSFLFLLQPASPLFSYTTLFRSIGIAIFERRRRHPADNRLAAISAGKAHAAPVEQRVLVEKSQRSHFARPSCRDRKSTRLNSSHVKISYAVFCLKIKIYNTTHSG